MSTALVTGANDSVGVEICRQLKRRNYDVVGVCHSSNAELDGLGVRVESGIDVGSDEAVAELSKRIGSTTLDLLIHAASFARPDSFEDFDGSSIARHLQVTSIGPLRVTRALRDKLERGAKVLITPASVEGDRGGGSYLGYEMARAALGVAVATLSTELERVGVTVALLDDPARRGHKEVQRTRKPSVIARAVLDRVVSMTAGDEALDDLKLLVELSPKDLETLRRSAPRTQPWVDAVVKEFYDTLYAHDRTARVFNQGERAARENTLREWYLAVAAGELDAAFWRQQWTVGLVHVRRQVKNTFMIAMMGRVQQLFLSKCLRELGSQQGEDVYGAFKRVTDTVTGLIVEGYLENYAQAMENVAGFRRKLIQRMIDMEVRRMLEAARSG